MHLPTSEWFLPGCSCFPPRSFSLSKYEPQLKIASLQDKLGSLLVAGLHLPAKVISKIFPPPFSDNKPSYQVSVCPTSPSPPGPASGWSEMEQECIRTTTSVQTSADLMEVAVNSHMQFSCHYFTLAIIISTLVCSDYNSDTPGVCEGDSGSPPALRPLHNHHQANCRG